ncbi:prepilin-type N-terminal cleavage/methylation domain-containing protein [Paramicrobacterium humi]|uniref:Prepilin-type N-terminal cleavage/methylation domain-containing protein n=1 Tax=Paramicrobacterium humi TaxID=640635 RepID=A0A1H4J3Q0_9MICO|nr:type II secretion system protein [Microbacterium humi]SEB40857.1 prepilin-type N-terminal cleavage/methylation domain-containing protein [Microbacterium humi]
MRRIRAILQSQSEPESGMTLIEVIVAMMIFAIIALGVAFTMTNVMSLTRDNRERTAAVNLAASEIDLVRSFDDVFAVTDNPSTKTVGGTTYTITRDTSWVSSSGADVSCTSGGDSLQYKRINVRVSWPEQKAQGANPVQADTILTPGSRINQPTTGTILVSVTKGSGSGYAGVTVKAVPKSGGATTITETIPATDADGCSYILNVEPGTYDVSINVSGGISSTQSTSTPKATTTVAEGTSSAVAFTYDKAATYNVNAIAKPNPAAEPPALKLASNRDVSFLSTYGAFTPSSAASSYDLFPWQSGYEALLGAYAGPTTEKPCTVVDPSAWEPDSTVDPALAGSRMPGAAADPGGGVTVDMPVAAVTILGQSGTLYATQQTTPKLPGEPVCTTTHKYNFGTVNGDVTIGLPYGTWSFSIATGGWWPTESTISVSNVTIVTGGVIDTAANVVTLDPRVAP